MLSFLKRGARPESYPFVQQKQDGGFRGDVGRVHTQNAQGLCKKLTNSFWPKVPDKRRTTILENRKKA